MPATKRFLNWTGVGFTPTSGTLSTATGVTNVQINNGGNLLVFSGDNDRYPTTVVNDFNDPTITVTTADLTWANAIVAGTRGVLVATHRDAKTGAGTGALTYTLTGAISQGPDRGGAHRAYGQATLIFKVESADGATDPIGIAIAV